MSVLTWRGQPAKPSPSRLSPSSIHHDRIKAFQSGIGDNDDLLVRLSKDSPIQFDYSVFSSGMTTIDVPTEPLVEATYTLQARAEKILTNQGQALDFDVYKYPYRNAVFEVEGSGHIPNMFNYWMECNVKFKEELYPEVDVDEGEVDIIWVIDDSGSMGDNQQALSDNASTFADMMAQAGIDVRYAVMAFSTWASPIGVDPWMAEVSRFKNAVLAVGTNGTATENGLNAIRQATILPGFRPTAQRFIVIVTDEDADDYSPEEEKAVGDLLIQKGITLYGIIDVGAAAHHYQGLIDRTGGYMGNINNANWSATLSKIAESIIKKMTSTIHLSASPESNLVVKVGGQVVPQHPDNGYTLTDQKIVINGSYAPDPDDLVEVEYEISETITTEVFEATIKSTENPKRLSTTKIEKLAEDTLKAWATGKGYNPDHVIMGSHCEFFVKEIVREWDDEEEEWVVEDVPDGNRVTVFASPNGTSPAVDPIGDNYVYATTTNTLYSGSATLDVEYTYFDGYLVGDDTALVHLSEALSSFVPFVNDKGQSPPHYISEDIVYTLKPISGADTIVFEDYDADPLVTGDGSTRVVAYTNAVERISFSHTDVNHDDVFRCRSSLFLVTEQSTKYVRLAVMETHSFIG